MSFVSVGAVEAADALADLLEISSHVHTAVLFDANGAVAASTLPREEDATALARRALDVVAVAATIRPGGPGVTRVEAVLRGGGLFVARDGERLIAATTAPDAPAALVNYDLRTALRRTAEPTEPPKPKPKRRPRAKKTEDTGDAA
jgi:hypothetical protein